MLEWNLLTAALHSSLDTKSIVVDWLTQQNESGAAVRDADAVRANPKLPAALKRTLANLKNIFVMGLACTKMVKRTP